MWAIRGRIVALASDRTVVAQRGQRLRRPGLDRRRRPDRRGHQGTRSRPARFADGAEVVDVGSSLVMPGSDRPAQPSGLQHAAAVDRADADHAVPAPQLLDPGRDVRRVSTTWPAYALITACPQELLAYVEAKAIVGGTTSIQGSPPKNRPRDGWLVRNIEDETFGTRERQPDLRLGAHRQAGGAGRRGPTRCATGSAFIYHCAEGQRGSIVAREFTDAERPAACSRGSSPCTPTPSTRPAFDRLARLRAPSPGRRSPTSGSTARPPTCPAARAAGISVCLGSDWAPSGTKHVLGELKVGPAGRRPPRLGPERLASWSTMATCRARRRAGAGLGSPGRPAAARRAGRPGGDQRQAAGQRLRARSWRRPRTTSSSWSIDGQPRYGTPELMAGRQSTDDHAHRRPAGRCSCR